MFRTSHHSIGIPACEAVATHVFVQVCYVRGPGVSRGNTEVDAALLWELRYRMFRETASVGQRTKVIEAAELQFKGEKKEGILKKAFLLDLESSFWRVSVAAHTWNPST